MEAEANPDKQQLIAQLLAMGFSPEICEQAYNLSEIKSLDEIIFKIEELQNPLPESKTLDNSQSISSMVNQVLSKELQEMGYSKNVSEKALFLSRNANIQKALDWINENKASPDFEEELRMVGQEENNSGPKLSKEEAAEKARELQRKLREKRLLKEKEDEEEREKNRVKSGKEMTQVRRELEEMQIKRDLELKLRQKKEDELARQRIVWELEKDKMERFGKKAGNLASNPFAPVEKEITKEQKILNCVKALKTAHPNNLFPGAFSIAFNTIKLYLGNFVFF